MADVTMTSLDETDELGITGLHFRHLSLAPGGRSEPTHEAAEEIYVVLGGNGTLHAGQDELPLAPETVVRVGAIETHHVVAGEQGLRLLAVATTGGRSYELDAANQPEVGGG